MTIFTYFIVALVLSFLGSIPVGLITLSIVQQTIHKGKKAGLLVSLGATIMEFVYTFIALVSLKFIGPDLFLGDTIKLIATVVFFGLGVYYLFKKTTNQPAREEVYDYKDFGRGVVVGAMNMIIIPFWIFIVLWLKSYEFVFDDFFTMIIFSLGATIGALLVFFIYIELSKLVVGKVKDIKKYTNKVVGIIFLGLGVFQLIRLL